MDHVEQIGYGDEDYRDSSKMQRQHSGAIPALAEEELMVEDDDYEDLYDGVNVGEGFSQFHRSEVPGTSSNIGVGGVQAQASNVPEPRGDVGVPQIAGNSGVTSDGRHQSLGVSFSEQKGGPVAVKMPEMGTYDVNHVSAHNASFDNMRHQGAASMAPKSVNNVPDVSKSMNPNFKDSSSAQGMTNNSMAGNVNSNANMSHSVMNDNVIRPQMDNGPTMLFVGELHWWTTDAELESVLSQYGKVKEIKFFDERASGKSKGYCQVEFYDSVAAAACKEGMNGHNFNGRACVVAFASPQTLKQMGAAYASQNPNPNQPQTQSQPQGRRNTNDGGGSGRGGGTNFQGGDGPRNYGRGWGRGGQGAAGRGPGGPRGRGPMGPRNSFGNTVGMGNGVVGNFGQGLGGPAFGGAVGGMMNPQAMMGAGFDPTFMGRGAGYGGFSAPAFTGMMPSYPAVNPMGLSGVAPHVNPAFFGRGMAPNGMGMMGSTGMEGNPGGMWADPGMGGWNGDEHGQRTRESSYGGDDGASDYGYGEAKTEQGSRTNAPQREKDRAPDRGDWSGNSERRYRDGKEQDWDRSDRERRYREEKDGYRDSGYDNDYDKGQSMSRSRSRSRAMPEGDHRSRSRDADYGKRRRAPSD